MHTMLDYINEEQKILTQMLERFTTNQINVENSKHCLILATGSSYNACLAMKYYLEQTALLVVDVQEPFHFFHYGQLDPMVDLVLAVSQSGKSASTIQAIEKITKEKQVKTIALTSDLNSPITHVVEEVLALDMGIETVGFVTKGYSATLLKLMLFGLQLAFQNNVLTLNEVEKECVLIKEAVEQIDDVIQKSSAYWLANKQALTTATRFVTIGYGPNVGTAKECETKFTETIRLPSQGFELEAYMHGPYLEADTSHFLFFIENDHLLNERSKALKNYMEAYVGACYTITTKTATAPEELGLSVNVPEKISPLLLVIPFQYLAYQIASAKGIDLSKRIFDDFDQVLKSKI